MFKKCPVLQSTPYASDGTGGYELSRVSFEESVVRTTGWSPRASLHRVSAAVDGRDARRNAHRGLRDQSRPGFMVPGVRGSPSPRFGAPSPRVGASPRVEKERWFPADGSGKVMEASDPLSSVPLSSVAEIPRARPVMVPTSPTGSEPGALKRAASAPVYGAPKYRPSGPLKGNIIPARPLSPSRSRPPLDTFRQLYEVKEKLGAGSYGEVYRATEKATGRPVAVKTMSMRADKCNPQRVQLEVAMLKRLGDCRGVAQFYGALEEGDNLHVIMELCTGGDLRDYIQENGPVTEAQAAVVAFQIFLLLRELHEDRVVHGDVKPANFVITNKRSHQLFKNKASFLARGWLKGVDFGCSQHTGRGRIHHKIGTPSHWAPEVFAQDYHIESDLWSAGVTIYELLAGRHPFCTKKEQQRMNERDYLRALLFKEPDFSNSTMKGVSQECVDFLSRLLCKNHKNRMTVKEAMDHTWMKKQLQLCRGAEKGALDGVLKGQSWAVPAMNLALF